MKHGEIHYEDKKCSISITIIITITIFVVVVVVGYNTVKCIIKLV